MPSRKQRRRREKLKRHDYEYVVETEEGEEVPLERPRARDKAGKDGRAAHGGPLDRRGRPIPKPSLGRVLKRTAIFAPLLLVFIYFTGPPDATTASKVFTAVTLLAFFIPFSYVVDVLVYRLVMRRHNRAQQR